MTTLDLPAGMQINAPILPGFETILTRPALELVAKLHRAFEPRRQQLLAARAERAKRLDAGERPDFLAETKHDPRRRLEDRADAAGAAMPPRRDHRPGRRARWSSTPSTRAPTRT